MSQSSGRVAWVTLWLFIVAAAGVALVFLFGKPASPPIAPAPTSLPATEASVASVPSTQPVVIQTYGQLLHADLANYPDTRPWAVPVDLNDAAHLILREPIYLCSRGDLWITRPDADPLPIVLARAAGESEHIVDRSIAYIIWSLDRRGLWEPSAICRNGEGFEIVSINDRRPIVWHRSYHWHFAITWIDGQTTRLIVPSDLGVSIITLGKELSEDYFPLTDSSAATQPSNTPAVLFDTRGVLAWIPADEHFAQTRVARYLDGKWTQLDSAAWPGDIVYLAPLLDGSVLQIRRDAAGAELTFASLDDPGINETEIAALVEELGDDDPDKRVSAYQRLTQYGPKINPILEKLVSTAAPEAQGRIHMLLQGATLGGMAVNGDQLTLIARLRDGGMVFCAPQGVSIPQEGQGPKVVSPDYLAMRPGKPVQELPAAIVDRLTKSGGAVTGLRDEWVVTTADIGPARYLPPDQFEPLLRPSERNYTHLFAIDGRGRWLLHEDSSQRTLILDPTVPDPTPRLAIWLIDTGNGAGWNKADWPVIQRGTAHWIVGDHDWQAMDPSEPMLTDTAKPTEISPLCTDPDGNRYYGGQTNLLLLTPAGRKLNWLLPDQCAGSADVPPWLASDRQGHLFLFNSTGRIARLRPAPGDAQPFALEAVFAEHVPDFQLVRRIWCDPAGRIDVAYEGSRMALIFPTGQVPPEIEDKILPQDLRRIDSP
jgi:hypothetical protein